MDDAMTSLNA